MNDNGTYQIEAGIERVEIVHNLGRAPNVVQVNGLMNGARVFTLDWRALLIVMPPGHEGCEVEWSVGYVEPPEPEHHEMDGD